MVQFDAVPHVGDDVYVPGVFVETVRIQNFGCVKDARLELTRLHALIGPNDSGKSTVLGAIRTEAELLQWGEQILQEAGRLDPRGMPGTTITMRSPAATIACGRDDGGWGIDIDGEVRPAWRLDHPSWLQGRIELASPARGATVVRWDPDAMRRPCELIPDGRPLTIGEKGEGIPAIYEAILSRDRQAFDAIEAGVRHHFPTVKAIWLPTSIESKKALGVTLTDGTRVHADVMSEGLLYWLAFAILPHVAQNAFLLIEEPENGLHPSRIAEVMKALRALSQHVQVVLATHSPLVINELEPEEVTLITRDSNSGTRATRIDRTSHFRQRNKVYALGELWLSFADGDSEAALVPADDSSHVAG